MLFGHRLRDVGGEEPVISVSTAFDNDDDDEGSLGNREVMLIEQCPGLFHNDIISRCPYLLDHKVDLKTLKLQSSNNFLAFPLNAFAFFFLPLLGLCIGHHGLSST